VLPALLTPRGRVHCRLACPDARQHRMQRETMRAACPGFIKHPPQFGHGPCPARARSLAVALTCKIDQVQTADSIGKRDCLPCALWLLCSSLVILIVAHRSVTNEAHMAKQPVNLGLVAALPVDRRRFAFSRRGR